MRRIVLGFALASAFAMPSADAVFDPPWITPAAATTSDIVSVSIRGGGCDAIVERPGYPQVTRNGNEIRVVEYGVRAYQDWCIYPAGTYTMPIGKFAAGHYTLTVDFAYDGYPFGLTTDTLGVIPFTVSGAAPPTPVPSLTLLWKCVLLVFFLGIACRNLAVDAGDRCEACFVSRCFDSDDDPHARRAERARVFRAAVDHSGGANLWCDRIRQPA